MESKQQSNQESQNSLKNSNNNIDKSTDSQKQFIQELNPQQQNKFKIYQNQVLEQAKIKFKEKPELIDKYTNENQLVRQFIARDHKEKDAYKLWEKWVNWMQENDADNIKECNIQDELKTGKCFLHGYDKKGNPILIVQTRYHIPKQIPIQQSKQFYLYLLEKAMQESEKVGTGRITVIWDRNGFSRKNFDSELQSMFKELIGIMQDTYAERLDSMIILHPNWFFRMIYGMVKIFLTQRTRNKIHVLPDLDNLQNLVDKDQMLQEHGGTSEFQYKFPYQVFNDDNLQNQFEENLKNQEVQLPQKENKTNIINQDNQINQDIIQQQDQNEDIIYDESMQYTSNQMQESKNFKQKLNLETNQNNNNQQQQQQNN